MKPTGLTSAPGVRPLLRSYYELVVRLPALKPLYWMTAVMDGEHVLLHWIRGDR